MHGSQPISTTSSPSNSTEGASNQLPNFPSSVPTQNTPWLEDVVIDSSWTWLPVVLSERYHDSSPTATGDNLALFPSMMSTQCPQYHHPTYSWTNLLYEESEQMLNVIEAEVEEASLFNC